MTIILSILLLLALILLGGKRNQTIQFDKAVKQLLSNATIVATPEFQYQQIINLPEPLKRYFKHVLKEGQPAISFIRMRHEGQFKTGIDKEWINITGEQYATTQRPGFIWKGTTSLFTARDMYIGDKGRLIVTLLSLYNMVDAQGEHYDQGELLRWLGESVLYPTNLLPSHQLQWLPIDTHKAKLIFNYNNLSLFFIFTFNILGEITEMETKRYMDNQNLETWVIKVADYEEMNDIRIPTSFEVLWRLAKGDFSYAKFTMTVVEYGKDEKF